MKRIQFSCILLVLLILVVGILPACTGDTPAESNPADISAEDSKPEEPQDPYKDKEGNYVAKTSGNTYSGKTITFLTCGVNQTHNSEIMYNDYDKFGEASSPILETINKAQKDRNEYVEGLLDVTVDAIFLYDGGRKNAIMAKHIRDGNLTFTEEYQIVVPCLYDGATLAQEGQFYDLLSINGLDMNAPWWDEAFNKECTIAGQLYFTIGDIGTINKSSTAALTFNKSLYERAKLDEKYDGSLYDIVRSGKWTLDLAIAMTKEFSEDKNGDRSITYEDIYGWGGQLDDMWSLFYGSGSKIASTDTADGYPALTMYSERSSTVMEKMQSLVQDKEHYVSANDYFSVVQWPTVLLKENFIAGDSLFFNGSVATPLELGEMEDAFGMVPIPKGDDTQDDYYSLVNPWTSTCFAVPICVAESDLPMIADFLNAIGAASANTVAPAFLNQALEYMKVRDDDTVDMIENYILPGRGCDVGMIFAWGGLDELLHTMASQSVGTFASNYQSREATAKNALAETNAFFASLQK